MLSINDDAGHHQADREADHRPRASRRAGSRRSRRRSAPARRVAVVGSGPAGLALRAAARRAPATPSTVFERADRIGGLLRYGIPDFKLEKHLIDRRIEQMEAEGVTFRAERQRRRRRARPTQLREDFDADRARRRRDRSRAICRSRAASSRASTSRWSSCRSRTRRVAGDDGRRTRSSPTGKHVVILGGGDTGSDCLGTSNRQGAKRVHQFELLPQPPDARTADIAPWPYWPMILRTSSSHEEGVIRDWSINTKRFSGDADGNVKKLHGVRLEWTQGRQRPAADASRSPAASSSSTADLVLLAMGFVGPERRA